VLDEYQGRGAFAQFIDDPASEFKSVAASGWNAELIPEEMILESQFPEVLAELRSKQARKDELEALFAEVAALEEGEWNEADYEVIPKAQIAEIKGTIKQLNSQLKEQEKAAKSLEKRIQAYRKAGENAADLQTELNSLQATISHLQADIAAAEAGIARHTALEAELRECTVMIRAIENRKDELVEQAREKITPEEAQPLITELWFTKLQVTLTGYLETHTRTLQQALEALHDKYIVTLTDILAEREKQTLSLNQFLEELGYE
jgi:type I restriction enzyme M protein